jgi:hypothetical protein
MRPAEAGEWERSAQRITKVKRLALSKHCTGLHGIAQ